MLDPKKKIKKYAAAVIVLLVFGVSVSGLRIQSVKHYREEQRQLADDIIVAEADTGVAVVVAPGEDGESIDSNTAESDLPSALPATKSAEEAGGSGEASDDPYSPQEVGNPDTSNPSGETKEKNTKSSKDKEKQGKRRNSAKSSVSSKQTKVSSGQENNGANSEATDPQKEYPKNPQKTSAAQAKATQKPSPTPTEEKQNFVCGIMIRCDSILKHMDEVDDEVKTYIPADGIILGQTSVKAETGDTAYSLLQKVCQAKDIALDTSYTNAYSSMYVRGIGYIYEKQVGMSSGWLYLVNGKLPGYGASRYQLKEGDQIEWVYSCTGKLE